MCSLARASDLLGGVALSCSVWIDSQVYMFGLGLISLGHREPLKGLDVQAHQLNHSSYELHSLMSCVTPKDYECNNYNDVMCSQLVLPAASLHICLQKYPGRRFIVTWDVAPLSE
jgi:hypothetical protein